MKKVLVINGSPRTENSNSYRLTKAFLKGWQEVSSDLDIEVLTPQKMNIHPCLGCMRISFSGVSPSTSIPCPHNSKCLWTG